jgi:hypothetical protein
MASPRQIRKNVAAMVTKTAQMVLITPVVLMETIVRRAVVVQIYKDAGASVGK